MKCLNPFHPHYFLFIKYNNVSPYDVPLHGGSLLPPCSRCVAVSPTRLLVYGQGRVPRGCVCPRLSPNPQDGMEGSVWIPILKESDVIIGYYVMIILSHDSHKQLK